MEGKLWVVFGPPLRFRPSIKATARPTTHTELTSSTVLEFYARMVIHKELLKFPSEETTLEDTEKMQV